MDFHVHSQVHSFCSMLVHGNTLHSRGTPFQGSHSFSFGRLIAARDTLNEPLFSLSGTHSRTFLHSLCCRCTLTALLLFLLVVVACLQTRSSSSSYSFNARDTLNGPLLSFVVSDPVHSHGSFSLLFKFLTPAHSHGVFFFVNSSIQSTSSSSHTGALSRCSSCW